MLLKISFYIGAFFLYCAVDAQQRINNDLWMKNYSIDNSQPSVFQLKDSSFIENNIKYPSLEFYKPEKPNGTAVLLIPGGGLHVLFSDKQGVRVAEWLNKEGISVFLFRHVLKKSPTNDPVQDLIRNFSLKSDYSRVLNDSVFMRAASDAAQAVAFLRECADEFHIRPDRIGLMGFSSGAAIGIQLYKNSVKAAWPDFLISLDGFSQNKKNIFSSHSAAFFIASISSTPLDEKSQSIKLYDDLSFSNSEVELHIYGNEIDGQDDCRWKKDLQSWLGKLQGI